MNYSLPGFHGSLEKYDKAIDGIGFLIACCRDDMEAEGKREAAYREVHARSSRLAVFEDLADAFEDIVGLLGRALEPEAEQVNLLELYERWRRTRDPRDARRLVAAGVRLDARGSDTLQ